MTKEIGISEVKFPEAKNLKKAINDGLLAYGNAKVRLHVLAVAALLQAASDSGNADYLTQIISSKFLSDKDKTNFRTWLGLMTAYTLEGETKPKNWLGFKEEKFFVKTGTLAHRTIDKDAALQGVRFYNMDKKAPVDPTLEMIMDFLMKIEKSVDSKAEKAGNVSIPVDVRDSIKVLAQKALAAKTAASVAVN